MRFGLCMIVKDEEEMLAGCLDAVLASCADVVVVDTGSTDGTMDILKSYGITPLVRLLDPALCYSKAEARNLAFDRIQTDWILCLDADERLSKPALQRIAALPENAGFQNADSPASAPQNAGYFCAWNTYRDGETIEDYKLPLFRKGMTSSGRVHENVQVSIRNAGLNAAWLDDVVIEHHPNPNKENFKFEFYRTRLSCAIAHDPYWHRYHWFFGYKLWREGDVGAAVDYLETVAASDSPCFPVECLNAKMLLAEIEAQRGERERVEYWLNSAQAFYARVAGDFEVKVNFRLAPWFAQATTLLAENKLAEIRAYKFPY